MEILHTLIKNRKYIDELLGEPLDAHLHEIIGMWEEKIKFLLEVMNTLKGITQIQIKSEVLSSLDKEGMMFNLLSSCLDINAVW